MNQETTLNAPLVHRRDLREVLPEVSHRVLRGEFATQDEIAAAYRVDPATVTRWKQKAIRRGLIDHVTWFLGLHTAQLRQALCHTVV